MWLNSREYVIHFSKTQCLSVATIVFHRDYTLGQNQVMTFHPSHCNLNQYV